MLSRPPHHRFAPAAHTPALDTLDTLDGPYSLDVPEAIRVSTREYEVLSLIADGLTHAQAARRLGISQHTVDTYVKRLRVKLGPGNKAHLVRMAARVVVDPDRSGPFAATGSAGDDVPSGGGVVARAG